RGTQLEEARSYFDRDNLEREFLEQSRLREWRENARNRILKWVFFTIATVAIGATVAAVWGGIAETHARRDQKQGNIGLQAKQQLTNFRLALRAKGELVAAFTTPQRDIALTRWDALAGQPDADSQFLNELYQCGDHCVVSEGTSTRLSGDAIRQIHQFRNSV